MTIDDLSIRVNLEYLKNSTDSDICDASLVLGHYLSRVRSTNILCRAVVELGSVIGAVGLTMKKLIAEMVVLTDLDANRDLLRKNASENFMVGNGFSVKPLPCMGSKRVWGSVF
eukprot:scaffold94187_cov52-Attheya_sp.AAC.4